VPLNVRVARTGPPSFKGDIPRGGMRRRATTAQSTATTATFLVTVLPPSAVSLHSTIVKLRRNPKI